MTKRLLEIAIKMNLHLATLLDTDTAEYFIVEQQRDILNAINDATREQKILTPEA